MPAITVQEVKGPFAGIAANGADFVFTAGDVGGDTFVCTGRELLIAFNSGGAPYTINITSVNDEKGRAGDIASYSIGAGEYASFGVGLTNSKGWKNSSGQIAVSVENAAVKWAVLRLPAGYP